MAKGSLKCVLEDSEKRHIYDGNAVFKDNIITYNDDGVMTKIVFDDVIWFIRKKDYNLQIGFKESEIISGTYETEYGIFDTKTEVLSLKKRKNGIEIKYRLTINDVYIDTFYLNFSYSIDTIKKYV